MRGDVAPQRKHMSDGGLVQFSAVMEVAGKRKPLARITDLCVVGQSVCSHYQSCYYFE